MQFAMFARILQVQIRPREVHNDTRIPFALETHATKSSGERGEEGEECLCMRACA